MRCRRLQSRSWIVNRPVEHFDGRSCREQRLPVLPIKHNRLLDHLAQIIKDDLFILSVTADANQARTPLPTDSSRPEERSS